MGGGARTMAIGPEHEGAARVDPSIGAEFAVVTVGLVGLYLWREAVTVAHPSLAGVIPQFEGLLVDGLVSGGVFVAGVGLSAAAYASYRGADAGVALPARSALPSVALAVVVPVLLVGLTKLVGALTGVPYNSLTMTAYAADASVWPVVAVAGLGLLVAVPTLVLVCQVFVQGSFRQVVEGDVAIVATTLLAGFAMVSDTGGLDAVPDEGKLAGTALFAIALGFGLYGRELFESERLRYLAYAPLALVAALVLLSVVAEIESVAGGLFVATHVVTLGVAAYTFDRTDSLLVPALAYLCLMLSNRTVVFVFEAGMQSW